jgi:hypothetical protein
VWDTAVDVTGRDSPVTAVRHMVVVAVGGSSRVLLRLRNRHLGDWDLRREANTLSKALTLTLIMWVLISGSGGPVAPPFNSSVDCETYLVQQGAFNDHCVPMWQ